jgi:hypothetical protein
MLHSEGSTPFPDTKQCHLVPRRSAIKCNWDTQYNAWGYKVVGCRCPCNGSWPYLCCGEDLKEKKYLTHRCDT